MRKRERKNNEGILIWEEKVLLDINYNNESSSEEEEKEWESSLTPPLPPPIPHSFSQNRIS